MTGPGHVGIDLVDIARFRALLARRPALASRLFTDDERAALAGRRDPVPGLAARFAAKEATLKALGVGIGATRWTEIEVLRQTSGAPELRLTGRAAHLAENRGVVHLAVSLTHTDALASAVVTAG